MTSGGWQSQEQRHGRHRRGATGAAWTPAVRPTDTSPAHARHDGVPAFRAADMGAPPAWPTSDVLTRRAGWPTEHEVPAARAATEPAWSAPRHRATAPQDPPSFLRDPIVPAPLCRPRHAAAQTVTPDMVADTVPMGGARHSRPEPGAESGAIVYAVPETPATGLRKFDLGTVPASVTPPRSWRRAAWFAVGTSAAVLLGLSVAAVELMGPVEDGATIDALPAYPTGPLTLGELPHEATTSDDEQTTHRPSKSSTYPSQSRTAPPSQPDDSPPKDTVIGSTTGEESVVPTEPPSEDTTTTPPVTSQAEPTRHTVGAAPVTPTNPQKMGDMTETYFQAVTTDPAAAHAMTTGGMAREGAEGIEARYGGVERIEVQDITIDRGEAITTSTVKVVHKDGTETVEQRQLTFTRGGDPKITADSTTA